MTRVRIGTRASPLALWQARHVAELLRPVETDLVLIETRGDVIRDRALSQIGGDGLFTKEIQNAVLEGRADLAVHSLKDLPTIPIPGLMLAAVPERAPTGDAFLSHRHSRFDELPHTAVLATSSLRRRSQVLNRRPDLQVIDLRGNVETRLRKLTELQLDGIILAEAGLRRLSLEHHVTEILDPSWMLPAVGQGALGLECREDDAKTLELTAPLNHFATREAVRAERAFLRALGGGCLVPIGSLGVVESETLFLRGVVLSEDGKQRIAGEISGPIHESDTIGEKLANQLLEAGARDLLPRAEKKIE